MLELPHALLMPPFLVGGGQGPGSKLLQRVLGTVHVSVTVLERVMLKPSITVTVLQLLKSRILLHRYSSQQEGTPKL